MAMVQVRVSDVDDGVTVYHDGTEVLHVDFMKTGETSFTANSGDEVKLVIHNLTGGAWHASLGVTVDGKAVYKEHPQQGFGFPNPEAFSHTVIIN